jgi:gluconokinase
MILTIDMGSSSVRALLFGPSGAALPGAESRREHHLRVTPDGGMQADADELFRLMGECIDETMARAGGPAVAAVSLCTFWHGLLGVSADGRALTPVYSWADTRSARDAEMLGRSLDGEGARQRTGCLLHPSYFPAKLAWLRRTEPELFGRVDWWCSPGEYCHFRLFGTRLCSLSMASGTGLLDLRACRWDAEMLEAAGVTGGKLSSLGDIDTPLRGLVEPHATRWPALGSIPWYPAMGDGACSNIGCGCAAPGRFALMVGTSGAMRAVITQSPPTIPRGLWCYRVDRRRLVLGGALGNGGNVHRWLTDSLSIGPDLAAADAGILRREPAGHGLTMLPFFTGERSTGWDPRARGAVIGLSLGTSPMDILQAGMEAVAYRMAAVFDLLTRVTAEPRQIVATGGALMRSTAWTQIMADVLERPITRPMVEEASSRGAALLALEALGALLPEAPVAEDMVEPRLEHAPAHRAARARQEKLKGLLASM